MSRSIVLVDRLNEPETKLAKEFKLPRVVKEMNSIALPIMIILVSISRRAAKSDY
jgi:hypothetical protein